MIVAGLTGSIAMGKSTVARMFADLGWPVFDADAAVRAYYSSPAAIEVEAAFPGVLVDGVVDRNRLSALVLGDDEAIARLEAIVHPKVAAARTEFLRSAEAGRRRGVFVDVPLLFETGGEKRVDMAIVVSASSEKQRARALSRAGMTPAKFEAIVARQMPDDEKRRRAHFVIDTNGDLEQSRRQAESFVRAVIGCPGRLRGNLGNA